jgi:hypothetical protein
MIALAVSRWCSHYTSLPVLLASSVCSLGDDELTILLLSGENPHEPTAIRCAAQLARSPSIDPARLAKLAVMEKCERVLSHIACTGVDHDPDGTPFWRDLLRHLPPIAPQTEPHLPHWTRFVSMPGIQRSGTAPTLWLVPRRSTRLRPTMGTPA